MEEDIHKHIMELEKSIMDGNISLALSYVDKIINQDATERENLNVKLIENRNGQRTTLIKLYVKAYDKDSVEHDFEEIMDFDIDIPDYFTVGMLKRWIYLKESFAVENQMLIIGDRIAGDDTTVVSTLIDKKDKAEIVLYLTAADNEDGQSDENDDSASDNDAEFQFYEEPDDRDISPYDKEAGPWSCKLCTFENKASNKSCEVCLNAKE